MDLTGGVKELLLDASSKLKGTARRTFMAHVVRRLGRGGQTVAQNELGWGRNTVRKGEQELSTGIARPDAFHLRGIKPVEARLPKLREDIRTIVEGQCQADPTFRTTRIYRRMSAAEVRRQLIEQKGYSDQELPSAETIRKRLNDMGFRPSKVLKSQPKKSSKKPMPSSTV